MRWSFPTSPQPPSHEPCLVTVDDALLTAGDRGRLHAHAGALAPRRWMTGAVHDADGRLVAASVRPWAGDPAAPVAVDAEVVRVPEAAETLSGTWRYAGHWTDHFGHFFLEVVPTLWGDPTRQRGLLVHRTTRGLPRGRRTGRTRAAPLVAWQEDLLDLTGYGSSPVRVVRHDAVRVERLLVPSRPVVLKAWAAPEAVAVWRRVSEAVGGRGSADRVFLSRSRFHAATGVDAVGSRSRRSDDDWDAFLDAGFARAGFDVVHPQEHSLREQVAVVRGCSVLAGASGSALHLSAFARPGTRVLEVGDRRSPNRAMPTQRMVDAACGHESAFVAFEDRAGLAQVLADL